MRVALTKREQITTGLKKNHNIDIQVLLNPMHADFSSKYCLEDPANENMLTVVKAKCVQRNTTIMAGFVGYHAVKTVLWRYGYGAHFFYKTRLMSIPAVIFGLWYSSARVYPSHLKDAGVADYARKQLQFKRDMIVLKKLMKSRAEYHSTMDSDGVSSVNDLVNEN